MSVKPPGAAHAGDSHWHRLDLPDADIRYWPDFIDTGQARELLVTLSDEVQWGTEMISIGGRRIPMPRLIAWIADPGVRYSYSGTNTPPQVWPDCLSDLRARLTELTGVEFNGVLANLYRDGTDSVGWHADNEKPLGPEPVVASVSLGAVRRFRLQNRLRNLSHAIDLADGSLLLMRGATQQHWRHCLSKTRRAVGPRINLSFRRVVGLVSDQ